MNTLKAPGRCWWFREWPWSGAGEMMGDGLVWLFSFPFFPPLYDVRIAFVWNTGHGAIVFVTSCCTLVLQRACFTQIAQDPSDASQREKKFSQLLPLLCTHLPFGHRDFFSKGPHPCISFHVLRARNGIRFPWWALFCCAFRTKYDLIYVWKPC